MIKFGSGLLYSHLGLPPRSLCWVLIVDYWWWVWVDDVN